jgi:hypothetical protein
MQRSTHRVTGVPRRIRTYTARREPAALGHIRTSFRPACRPFPKAPRVIMARAPARPSGMNDELPVGLTLMACKRSGAVLLRIAAGARRLGGTSFVADKAVFASQAPVAIFLAQETGVVFLRRCNDCEELICWRRTGTSKTLFIRWATLATKAACHVTENNHLGSHCGRDRVSRATADIRRARPTGRSAKLAGDPMQNCGCDLPSLLRFS